MHLNWKENQTKGKDDAASISVCLLHQINWQFDSHRKIAKKEKKKNEDNGANEITECYLKFLLLWYFRNLQQPRPR